jgi:hypothetical protein
MMKKLIQITLLISLTNITTSYCDLMRSIEERNMLSDQNKTRIDATKEMIAILEANLAEEEKENNELRENIGRIYDRYTRYSDNGAIYQLSMPNHTRNRLDNLMIDVKYSNKLIEYHKEAINEEQKHLKLLILQSEKQYGITYLN